MELVQPINSWILLNQVLSIKKNPIPPPNKKPVLPSLLPSKHMDPPLINLISLLTSQCNLNPCCSSFRSIRILCNALVKSGIRYTSIQHKLFVVFLELKIKIKSLIFESLRTHDKGENSLQQTKGRLLSVADKGGRTLYYERLDEVKGGMRKLQLNFSPEIGSSI